MGLPFDSFLFTGNNSTNQANGCDPSPLRGLGRSHILILSELDTQTHSACVS